jgi:PBP1b-binding outer membrane lipoprotein LpoB
MDGAMMKRMAVAASAVLFLAGCATPAAAPERTVTVTQEAPAPIPKPEQAAPLQGDDETYLGFLRSKGIYASAETSIEVGKTVCEALDDGYDVTLIMALAIDSGFTQEEAAAIIAAAILTYCPWNKSKVTSY